MSLFTVALRRRIDKSLVSKPSYETQAGPLGHRDVLVASATFAHNCHRRRLTRRLLPPSTASGSSAVVSGHVLVNRKSSGYAGHRRRVERRSVGAPAAASGPQVSSVRRSVVVVSGGGGDRYKRSRCPATWCRRSELLRRLRPILLSRQMTHVYWATPFNSTISVSRLECKMTCARQGCRNMRTFLWISFLRSVCY